MTTAIYSLSADPITFGHIDIIERASKAFDRVIVAIGDNPAKKYLLNKDQRLSVAKQSLHNLKNVAVFSFDGLLVDFAYQKNATVIIRGLRNPNDFLYEQDLTNINETIDVGQNLDTFYLLAKPLQNHISSSTSKALVKEHTFAEEYLPLPAKFALEKIINNQIFIGITGLMGSGKSFIADQITSHFNESLSQEFSVLNLDLDIIVDKIYKNIEEYPSVKNGLMSTFGTIDKKEIAKMAFTSDSNVSKLEEIFYVAISYEIRQQVKNFEGIVLLNAAKIISSKFLKICNNNIIFVSVDDETRYKRCSEKRGISQEEVEKRLSHQLSEDEQIDLYNESQKTSNFGSFLKIDNSKESFSSQDNFNIMEQVSEFFYKLEDEI